MIGESTFLLGINTLFLGQKQKINLKINITWIRYPESDLEGGIFAPAVNYLGMPRNCLKNEKCKHL